MANTGVKGSDARQSGTALIFRAFLQDSTGAILATGTTTYTIDEMQSDGTIKSYDFADNSFKATALTTATASMTHRPRNNAGTSTGVWTSALSTLTGFTRGAMYVIQVTNTGASPAVQTREFEYGDGDIVIDSSGRGYADVRAALGTAVTLDANNVLNVSAKYWAGTAITATSIPVGTAAGASGGLQIAGSNAATTYASLTVTGAFSINGTNTVSQTGDSYARIGTNGAGLTAIGDTRMANLDAAISSRSTFAGGAVASVTGNVGGNVTGSVGSIATGGISSSSFAAGATVPRVTLTDTVTTLTNAPTLDTSGLDAQLEAIKTDTTRIRTTLSTWFGNFLDVFRAMTRSDESPRPTTVQRGLDLLNRND